MNTAIVKTFNILFVDDDTTQTKMYLDVIDSVKDSFPTIEIKTTCESTFERGKDALYKSDFDAAVIDLKLSSNGIEGNKIIREIRDNLRFPVVVYSGFPQDLDPDLAQNNCFFKVYKRTDVPFSSILTDLINLFNTGITNIFGQKGLINESINKIFWDHIATAADYWVESCTSSACNMEKIVLRFAMSHLQEYLELDEDGKFETYDNSEVYIIPPIKTSFFTGDILKAKSDGKNFVILTPSCDFAQVKAGQVAIAEIERIDMDLVKIAKSKLKSSDETKNTQGENILKSLVRNNSSIRYHFLPPFLTFEGGFINFQKIYSIEYDKLSAEYTRFASISDRFIKDIISHFSHYYARQGQPDLNFDRLYDMMLKL